MIVSLTPSIFSREKWGGGGEAVFQQNIFPSFKMESSRVVSNLAISLLEVRKLEVIEAFTVNQGKMHSLSSVSSFFFTSKIIFPWIYFMGILTRKTDDIGAALSDMKSETGALRTVPFPPKPLKFLPGTLQLCGTPFENT